MPYDYQRERPGIFTEEGQRLFLKIRDNVQRLCREAGCVRMDAAISGCTGDSWGMTACVDRLVELGELIEVPQARVPGQYRIFYRPHSQ